MMNTIKGNYFTSVSNIYFIWKYLLKESFYCMTFKLLIDIARCQF